MAAPAPSPDVWDRINAAVDGIESETVSSSRPSVWIWRTFAVAATLLIAVSAISLFRDGSPQPAASAAARLERLGPGVTIYRDAGSDRSPIEEGGTIEVGETLSMGPGAAAIFAMDGVGRFRVAGGTTLRMVGPRVIELEKGEVIADIVPGGRGFEIRAPQAKAVVLGTLFRVFTSDGRTALTVARGKVAFSNASGAVEVHEGLQSTAGAGGAPEAPLELAADAADWDLFRSVAPGPRVDLQLIEAAAGHRPKFTITLTSDAPTDVEVGVTERTYVILTLEDPAGNRRLLRLAPGDLSATPDLPSRNGLASIDSGHRLVLSGELPALDLAGNWSVTAIFASRGREESWAGYAESAVRQIQVKR